MKGVLAWRVVFLVVLAAVFSCCPPRDPGKVVRWIEDETVALVDQDGDMYCAGVWIARDRILTAAHCVDDVGMPPTEMLRRSLDEDDEEAPWNPVGQTVRFKVRSDPGGPSRRLGVILRFARSRELALIEVGAWPAHEIAVLSGADLVVGDEVHVVGHPLGKTWSYSHGYVSNLAVEFMTKPGPWLQIDVGITSGNSGGGAFDRHGRLVGIAALAASSGHGNFAWFVPRDAIREFLR